MLRQWVLIAAAAGVVLAGSVPANAGLGHRRGASCNTGGCGDAGCSVAPAPCGPVAPPVMVERTIMVPQMTTETRTVKAIEYRREQREKTITVTNRVPKQETITRECTVMVPKTVTKTISYPVRKPVISEETVEYTVCVPHTETKNGTRKVCKMVATEKTRTVTVDEGHWEDAPAAACESSGCSAPSGCDSCRPRRRLFRACSTGCGPAGCGACAVGSCETGGRVWVAKPVQKEIAYTCHERVWEDQPYTYNVTVMKKEQRTRTVKKCSYVCETKTKEVSYQTCVAEKQTKSFNVTRYECVPVEKTVSYTVCVPYEVEKEVQVAVCKMVPKTIQVPEGGCSADAGCCDDGCDTGCGRTRRARRCRGC